MNNVVYTGQLDTRVSVFERVYTTSSTGEQTFVETLVNNGWAKIEDVSGSEEADGKIIALNVRRYVLRYDPVIIAKNITELFVQEAVTGDTYNIHSVGYIGRKEYIEFKCSKRE